MKILLASSSMFLYDHLRELTDKPLDQLKIAWITTAKKGSPNKEYVAKHRNQMIELGWDFEEMDIEGKSEDELRGLLKDKDVIYVHGGNPFYLLQAIKAGAFEKVLYEKLNKGALYAGVSAGSYVACPTIEMGTWKSGSKYKPYKNQDLRAMNLVPFLVTVHYKPEYKKEIEKGAKNRDLDVYVLTDEQALFVENGKIQVLGSGDQLVIK